MQFKSVTSAETLGGTPPPLCKDLGDGYTPLLSKNYSPPKNLLISAKIEKWAIFGIAAHLWPGRNVCTMSSQRMVRLIVQILMVVWQVMACIRIPTNTIFAG